MTFGSAGQKDLPMSGTRRQATPEPWDYERASARKELSARRLTGENSTDWRDVEYLDAMAVAIDHQQVVVIVHHQRHRAPEILFNVR